MTSSARPAIWRNSLSTIKFTYLLPVPRTIVIPCLLLLLLALRSGVTAQHLSGLDGYTPAGLATGNAGSYALSDFDNINYATGSLNFQLPLMSIAGRGSAGYTMTLALENKWHIESDRYLVSCLPSNICTYDYRYIAKNYDENTPRAELGPGVMVGRWAGVPDPTSCTFHSEPWYNQTLTRLSFVAPDGTETELIDKANNGQPLTTGATCNLLNDQGPARGRIFVAHDGSAVTFISDTEIYDKLSPTPVFAPTGYLLLADGTRYRVTAGKVTWIRDRQGNQTTFAYDQLGTLTTITDSIGRVISIARNPNDTVINFPGSTGATRALHLGADENVWLRADYTSLTWQQAFNLNGSNQWAGGPGRSGPTYLQLPDNRRYQFRYNQYGELARVELPTGGAIEYDWEGVSGNTGAGGAFAAYGRGQVRRRVKERRVYNNGGSGAAYDRKMTFTYNANTYLLDESCEAREYGPGDVLLTRTVHYFMLPVNAWGISNPLIYSDWREGRENKTEYYAADGTLLRRVEQNWQPRSVTGTLTWDPRVVESKATLEPNGANLVSKQTFAYSADEHNNQTDAWEYGFGSNAPSAYPVRHTHTDYLTFNNGLNYAGPANGASYEATDPHLRKLPSGRQIYAVDPQTGAQTLAAQSETRYDEVAYPATTYSAVSGWSAPTTTARGNATTTRVWLDTTGSYLETHTWYDQVGNVVKTRDALGREATVSYTDSFADNNQTRNTYAFATQATTPIPDTTGTNGSSIAFSSTAKYDYWTGQVISSINANGQTSTFAYESGPQKLDRLTNVTGPLGTETQYEYGDNAGNLYLRTQTKLSATRWAESYTYFDGLGRSVRAYQRNDDATQAGGSSCTWLGTETRYDETDGAGHAQQRVSNPFCASSAGAGGGSEWTTSITDALGRAILVKAPDNAGVPTSYNGNMVTVTDPAGKQRRSVTDALGRLVQVVEDPTGGGFNYVTNYSYDALGNLTQVNQSGQVRYFLYDSLSRLRAAKNPEQGNMVTGGTAFAGLPTNGAGGWSLAYLYDLNGNLTKRRDANNIETNYTYDALNRNLTTSYTDGSTPAVTRYYDGWRNGTQEVANARGQLHRTETYGTAIVALKDFDALGRPLTLEQQFGYYAGTQFAWSAPYKVTRTFDLTLPTGQTYPSQHTAGYAYDEVGRLAAFSGNLGDGVARTYADAPTFGARGLQEERFSTLTRLYHKLRYNERGQLWDVRLSSVSDAQDPNADNPALAEAGDRGRIVNYYAANYQKGVSGADNNGNLLRQVTYLPGGPKFQQNYTYDNLNRLTSVTEKYNGTGEDTFKQQFDYDAWGNRTINQAATFNAPKPNLVVDTAANNNRLCAPGDIGLAESQRALRYDAAGNLTYDVQTGQGARLYDAENRMRQAWGGAPGNGSLQGQYTYDGDGRRIIRQSGGVDTWQVSGFGGELVAEYAAQSSALLPQKEYGYEGGKLLISALNGDETRLRRFVENFYRRTWLSLPGQGTIQAKVNALAAQGLAGEEEMLTEARALANELFTSATYTNRNTTNGMYVADLYLAYLQRPPDEGGFQYWVELLDMNAISRATLRDAFAGVCAPPQPPDCASEFRTLVKALRGNGTGDYYRVDSFANYLYTAASANSQTPPTQAQLTAEHARFDTAEAQNLAATQAAAKQLGRDLVGQYANNYRQEWTNDEYVTRLYALFLRSKPDKGYWSWVAQLEENGRQSVLETFLGLAAYQEQASALYREIYWLVGDQLGTPRIIAERTGSLTGIKRHDYLPFGEVIQAGVGGRSQQQGYVSDSVRQGFTAYERDDETGLDYAQARYMSSAQGRFISVDPYNPITESKKRKDLEEYLSHPPNWNRYVYVWNNPLKFNDPTGEKVYTVLYTTGNTKGDDELRRSAETRADEIRNMKGFDPKKDTVVLKGVESKEDFARELKGLATLEKEFGKVAYVSLYSHAGPNDGPVFHGGDSSQFKAEELSKLSVNWDTGAYAVFFGCNTAKFAQNFADAQGVNAYGYDKFAYFSVDPNKMIAEAHNTAGAVQEALKRSRGESVSPSPLYLIAADYGNENGADSALRYAAGIGKVYPLVLKIPRR